ncbi:flagellin [Falsigemmobacter intermedius]|uniref:Flagellin n=1 Tax=Falsigemmobacter intermedius TaxID=1553448 RepID=A0A451GGV5_9RHOB|nr:flagellin [Falsigemmobacter intermedius]RWY36622.1 flagellin [Falsigemmobacter intermedius]
MSSILTNTSAMVALQTLKGINTNLSKTQDEISTGKSVATARDNSAVWAISKVMEADVKGFSAISASLALGSSTIAVARDGAETITNLLTDMKQKIVAAQEDNVDRAKIQTDIKALAAQIKSVTDAAQFNGLNMLSNKTNKAGADTVDVLSSLDRSSTAVNAANITVGRQDLTTTQASLTAAVSTAVGSAVTLNATQSVTVTMAPATVITAGMGFAISLTGAAPATGAKYTAASYTTGTAVADQNKIAYVARDGDTQADVMRGLAGALAGFMSASGLDTDVLAVSASANTLTFTSKVSDADHTIAISVSSGATAAGNVIGGGLAALDKFDVSTKGGAKSALMGIEGMLQTSIAAAAKFGSAQGRIDIQASFVSKLTDSLKAGIGSMVDADMEEASARLQALQVQQQLSIQALSIANQAPQNILALFR